MSIHMQTKRRNTKEVIKDCIFCKEGENPDFLDVDRLSHFLSERGKILARARTGACAKHQRKLTYSIKHARHLALLPFVVRAE